jgi:hypothetical protein
MAIARLIIILLCLATIICLVMGLSTNHRIWYRRAGIVLKILVIAALIFFGFLLLTRIL